MRTRLVPLLVAASVLSTAALAQSPAISPFAPIEFVVGSCWVGTFPDGKQTDEHCFEWMFDRKFVRDRHVVRGGAPYQGESIYSWSAAEKRVVFSYWNSDGDVITGHVETTSDGVLFPQRIPTPKGPVDMQSLWTRSGPDGYRVTVTQRAGDSWKTLWTMELARKR